MKKMLIPIEHEMRHIANENYGMIVPFGDYKNSRLVDCEIGSKCISLDKHRGILISRVILVIPSLVANAISMMLYNMDIENSFGRMVRNWEGEVFEDRALFIVIEKIGQNDKS